MNKTLLFLLLPGLLISCKPTPPSGDNGEIVPLTSECLLKNSDLYMKYPYKIKSTGFYNVYLGPAWRRSVLSSLFLS